MGFPRVLAAQRLQIWLLVTALVAIAATGVLVVDLTRNLRTVIIGETKRALSNAVSELKHAEASWESASHPQVISKGPADQALQKISYDVLRSYPDIEGGYLWDDSVIGHSFPSYTEPGSTDMKIKIESMQLMFLVRDGNGNLIQNLRTSDFQLTENGEVKQISVVQQRDIPLNACIMVDTSWSIGWLVDNVVRTAFFRD